MKRLTKKITNSNEYSLTQFGCDELTQPEISIEDVRVIGKYEDDVDAGIFTSSQFKEILSGILSGVNVSVYARSECPPSFMRDMREGLERALYGSQTRQYLDYIVEDTAYAL